MEIIFQSYHQKSLGMDLQVMAPPLAPPPAGRRLEEMSSFFWLTSALNDFLFTIWQCVSSIYKSRLNIGEANSDWKRVLERWSDTKMYLSELLYFLSFILIKKDHVESAYLPNPTNPTLARVTWLPSHALLAWFESGLWPSSSSFGKSDQGCFRVQGAFHSVKVSEISGQKSNGTWKFPGE